MEKTNGSSGTMYWPGPSGTLSETNLTGTINEEYVYFNGQRIARVDRPSGTVHYYFSNHLGSHTMVTSATGSCEQDVDYFPYGGEITDHCPNVAQHYKFTGKERDTESGLDNFGARYNASSLGRFMTPDPLQPSRSHPLLLQQFLADPQNWNKYAYGLNNPVKDTDQGGHFTGDDHERIQTNAMLANGYSPAAVHIAATADRHMDNASNMASGVPILHHFTSDAYQNQANPQHGETGDHQTREQAEGVANAFMSSKINDAATRALQGDVRGALTDIGQASHTAQDIVRHNFETASQHPYGEAPATATETRAATLATQNVLDQFTNQVYQQGLQQGLSMNQIMGVMGNMQRGTDQQSPVDSANVGGPSDSQ